jgi:hypothetical protein
VLVSLVNPHVLPFMSRSDTTQNEGLVNKLKSCILSEVQHRILQVRILQISSNDTVVCYPLNECYWIIALSLFCVHDTHYVHRFILQLGTLGLIPKRLSVLPIVLSQKYRGDITIIPDFTINDYLRLLSNPTPEWVKEASLKAERKTWSSMSFFTKYWNETQSIESETRKSVVREKMLLCDDKHSYFLNLWLMDDTELSLIQHHCAIEFALDECLQKLRKTLNKRHKENAFLVYKNKIK